MKVRKACLLAMAAAFGPLWGCGTNSGGGTQRPADVGTSGAATGASTSGAPSGAAEGSSNAGRTDDGDASPGASGGALATAVPDGSPADAGGGASADTSGAGGAGGDANGLGTLSDGADADPCAARAGLLFCDTFEAATGTQPSAPWSTSINGSGTVTVDGSTPAHSGTKSIHISDGDADYDTLLMLHDASLLPAPSGRFYVRTFIRLGAAMSAGHNSFILSDVFASQGQGNNVRLGEDDKMLMYTVMGDAHGALSNANYYSDGMMPGLAFTPLTWTCLEILIDSKKPEFDVWVGGAEVADLHHTDWALDDDDTLRFGFEKYAGPAMDVWFDDIAIGTQPIGCD